MKPEQWGSPLVQEKYQEETACDKRCPYRIITITIIIIIIVIIVVVVVVIIIMMMMMMMLLT